MKGTITDQMARTLTSYPHRRYPKGQIVLFADEVPDYVYFIAEGRVREYYVSYRGEEVVVDVIKAPGLFPLSWGLNLTPNQYFYKTETPANVYLIPAHDLLSFMWENPGFAIDILSKTYRAIDAMLGRMVQLMSGTAKSRVMYELVMESKRFSKVLPNRSRVLSVNESDIAARSGLTRETVCREVRKLRESHTVDIRNNVIVVNNLSALERRLKSMAM